MMKYIKKLEGIKCYLSPINLEDSELITKWSNNLEMSIYTGDVSDIITYKKQKEYLEHMNSPRGCAFSIIDIITNELIGIVRLMGLDHINRKSYFGIFIGKKENRNKGIGTEATQLMLDYGFNVLNLRNIMLEVFSFNEGAIAAYKKCGFKEIGRRRNSIIYGDNQFDEVYMDILSDEFQNSIITRVLK